MEIEIKETGYTQLIWGHWLRANGIASEFIWLHVTHVRSEMGQSSPSLSSIVKDDDGMSLALKDKSLIYRRRLSRFPYLVKKAVSCATRCLVAVS